MVPGVANRLAFSQSEVAFAFVVFGLGEGWRLFARGPVGFVETGSIFVSGVCFQNFFCLPKKLVQVVQVIAQIVLAGLFLGLFVQMNRIKVALQFINVLKLRFAFGT